MIVQTVLKTDINIRDQTLRLGPAKLYDLYTQMCALRDIRRDRRNQFLSHKERLEVCRGIAEAMSRKGRMELTLQEVLGAIAECDLRTVNRAQSLGDQEVLMRARTDVSVCSFLRFGDDGSLRFAHNSFCEFFVAQNLVRQAGGKQAVVRAPGAAACESRRSVFPWQLRARRARVCRHCATYYSSEPR
jgi:hypothetical protein